PVVMAEWQPPNFGCYHYMPVLSLSPQMARASIGYNVLQMMTSIQISIHYCLYGQMPYLRLYRWYQLTYLATG
ncbi:MAG: hypothetical protein ACPICC_01550, partial [Candidatus Puniceispirillaceae bacterium]